MDLQMTAMGEGVEKFHINKGGSKSKIIFENQRRCQGLSFLRGGFLNSVKIHKSDFLLNLNYIVLILFLIIFLFLGEGSEEPERKQNASTDAQGDTGVTENQNLGKEKNKTKEGKGQSF